MGSDHTDFVKSRLASDNVGGYCISKMELRAWLLQLQSCHLMQWRPLTISSGSFCGQCFMWWALAFLSLTLSRCCMIIQQLWCRICSPPFPICRRSRRCCPLSPLVSALSFKLLAQTVCHSPLLLITHHHISLYMDDMLLYINSANLCVFSRSCLYLINMGIYWPYYHWVRQWTVPCPFPHSSHQKFHIPVNWKFPFNSSYS